MEGPAGVTRTGATTTRRVRLLAGLAVVGLGAVLLLAATRPAVVRTLFGPSEPTTAAPPPTFLEAAVAAGVEHRYDGGFSHFVGGGVAAFDCDEDDRPDLYLAGGSGPAGLYVNRSTPDALAFDHLTATTTDLTDVTGAYPLDIDSDGRQDLVVLRVGPDAVLRGLGGCRFERAEAALDIDTGDGWTTAFSATWEGEASLPTLAFGDYVVVDEAGRATSECATDRLLRPRSDGTGYAPPIALEPGWCSLSMLFSDWDRSGRRDLRVSNDRHYYRDGEEQLWRIEPGQPPQEYRREDGWARLRIFGMGIASHDLTGDGYPEVFLTSQGDNKLQTLADGAARPLYEDIALRRGATAHRPYAGDDILPSTAWHPAFADVNNDGFIDLYVSKGNVEAQEDYAMRDPSNLLIGQPDGTFIEGAEAAGMVDFARARGAAVVDLDGDGWLDIVQVVRREPVRIWHNQGAAEGGGAGSAHWIGVQVQQDGQNPDAIGAWVEVRAGTWRMEHELTVGGGHVSGQAGPVHIGLGPVTSAEVRVTWPDGEVGPWQAVEADRTVVIRRGADPLEERPTP
jgi:hypothetical protein